MTNRQIALITGASFGIGAALGRLMASNGWDLILTSRRESLLNELAGELRDRHRVRVEVFPADLSDLAAPKAIFEYAQSLNIQIDALVNNAAFGYYGAFRDQDVERHATMVEVNITALLRLTSLFLPGMLERGKGRIMNVASTASFQPVPLSGVYAATKAFVLSWSLSLVEELRGTGVTVTTLCPGVTRTGFQAAAGKDYLTRAHGRVMSPDEVARIGYRAMMQGRRLVVAGLHNKTLAQGTRLASKALAARVAHRIMKGNLSED